jgi:hypothetical protein
LDNTPPKAGPKTYIVPHMLIVLPIVFFQDVSPFRLNLDSDQLILTNDLLHVKKAYLS